MDVERSPGQVKADRNGLQDTKDSAGTQEETGNEAQRDTVVQSRGWGALRHQCQVPGSGTKAMSPISVHTQLPWPPTPTWGGPGGQMTHPLEPRVSWAKVCPLPWG